MSDNNEKDIIKIVVDKTGDDHEGVDHEGDDQEGIDHKGDDQEGVDHEGVNHEDGYQKDGDQKDSLQYEEDEQIVEINEAFNIQKLPEPTVKTISKMIHIPVREYTPEVITPPDTPIHTPPKKFVEPRDTKFIHKDVAEYIYSTNNLSMLDSLSDKDKLEIVDYIKNKYNVKLPINLSTRDELSSPIPESNRSMEVEANKSVHSSRTEKSIYNNWTEKNRKTVISWRDDLTQIGFAYDYVISKYKKKEKKYSIWLFIISTVMTTVSFSQFNNSEQDDKTFDIIFKTSFSILSFITTILSGIQKINNYSQYIEEYRTYINELENFVTILSSELMLPDNLRKDALEFILLHRNTFKKLLSSNPDIDEKHYKEGIDNYLSYIDNIKNRKYNCKQTKFNRSNSIDIGIEMSNGPRYHSNYQTRPPLHLG